MNNVLAIVVYGCEIAGARTESLDFQVRYFDPAEIGEIEARIRAEPLHSYSNDIGEVVSWPFLRIAAIEHLEDMKDGAEVIGFISGGDELAKWARGDVA